jgi:hypothetical protein
MGKSDSQYECFPEMYLISKVRDYLNFRRNKINLSELCDKHIE